MNGLRNGYILKHLFVFGFIFFDLSINTVIDDSSDSTYIISLTAAQAIGRLCSLFLVFIFMWQTFVFKYGLLGVLCYKFKYLFGLFPISLAFCMALRISRILAINNSITVIPGTNIASIDLWAESWYVPIFVIHNLLSCCYYVAILNSVFELADPIYYKADAWIHR